MKVDWGGTGSREMSREAITVVQGGDHEGLNKAAWCRRQRGTQDYNRYLRDHFRGQGRPPSLRLEHTGKGAKYMWQGGSGEMEGDGREG